MNFRFDRQRKKRRRKITQQSIHPQHKYQNWNLLALLTLRKTSDKILLASTSPKIESCKNFPHWKVSNADKTERHSEILKCTGRSYILGQFFFFFKNGCSFELTTISSLSVHLETFVNLRTIHDTYQIG